MDIDDDDLRAAPRQAERPGEERSKYDRPRAVEPLEPQDHAPVTDPSEPMHETGQPAAARKAEGTPNLSVEEQLAIAVADLEVLCDAIRGGQRRQDQQLMRTVRETMESAFEALLTSNRGEMKTAFREATKEAGTRLGSELSKSVGETVRSIAQDPADKWREAKDQIANLTTRIDELEKDFERIVNRVLYASVGISIIYSGGIILAG